MAKKAQHSMPLTRSEHMARVRRSNTGPEVIVRKALHGMGFRFRLHDKRLPGTPDIVMRRFKTVVFVHGCFWHRHGCSRTTTPKTNVPFWEAKFEANRRRDVRQMEELDTLGWRVVVIWECETRNAVLLEETLRIKLRNSTDNSRDSIA